MPFAAHPYWWDTLSRPSTSHDGPLLLPSRVDAAVIGGGYTGLSAARALALAGARTLVLERGEIGSGASSRNAGQVLTGLRIEPAALVGRFGETRARALYDLSLDAMERLERLIATEHIDCDLMRTGHLQAAAKPAHFAALAGEQALLARVFRREVTLVPRADQRREIGSDRYFGLLVDEASLSLNPAKYVAGLAATAARAGATTAAGTPVERMTRAAGGWRLSTPRGSIDAASVLVATNGYVTSLTPALQRRFLPVGSYIVVTERLDESTARALLPRGRMAFDSKHFLYYFRLTSDWRLLFGGRAEFGMPTPESARRAAAILLRGIAEVFPQLGGVKVDYAWGGNVAFTRDELPHAGSLDGVWFAGGYGGHGIAMATRLGELVAARMGGASEPHPLFDLPCRPVPLLRGRPWFLPAVGAWYRLKDWLS